MYSINNTPSDLLLKISSKHKTIRKKQKISQEELAKRSGVSLGSLKRFEHTGKIALESLLKLAHTLGRLEDFSSIFNYNEENEDIAKLFSDKMKKS